MKNNHMMDKNTLSQHIDFKFQETRRLMLELGWSEVNANKILAEVKQFILERQ
jgi:hypothetical protein